MTPSRPVLPLLVLGVSLVPAVLAAQDESPALPASDSPATSSSSPSSDIIELSPFAVVAEEDDGYSATVTTSGSRIRTSLEEVAASVSVLTADFLDDLAATDVTSALAFVAGAESSETTHLESVSELGGGNQYVGGDFGDNNNRTGGEVRVRGLGRATTTMDYIEVTNGTDRYNIERSEFLRGANSILFGIAEPAGLVNMQTKEANLSKDRTQVSFRTDDFGSNRVVLDHNEVISDDRFAVRAVALYGNQKYSVDHAFSRNRRLFLTGTFRPFRGTTLRGYYENIDVLSRRPNNRTVTDNVSEWLNAYNQYAPQMTPAQIESTFFWNPLAPSATGLAGNSIVTLADGSTVDLGLIRRTLTSTTTPAALIYEGNGQWTDPMGDVLTVLANRTVTGGLMSPTNQRTYFLRSGSRFQNATSRISNPQVTDPGIFPFEDIELAALPGNYRQEVGERAYASLEQRITRDFYVAASFMRETRDFEQYFAMLSQNNEIALDINRNLPDGRANPNFLRPFIYGRNIGEAGDVERDTLVVQANYDFDFAEKIEKLGFLGSHRLTAVYTDASVDALAYRWNYRINNEIPGTLGQTGTNGGVNSASRWAFQMWYVGDPVQLGDTALRFTGFPDTLDAHIGRSYDYLYYNNTATPRAWQVSPTQAEIARNPISGGRSYTLQENDGIGVSLQSYFWKRRIITLVGWRRDNVMNEQGIPRPDTDFTWPYVASTNRSDYLPDGSVFENTADTMTKSIVFRATPSLRLFANESENFAATTPRQDNLFRQIAPQSGNTLEYGVGLDLFKNKLRLKLTRFESSQDDATSSTAVAGLRIVAFEDSLYDALAAAGRLGEWVTIGQDRQPSTDRYERPTNASTTQDVVSEGYSLEASWKPNRRWDVIFSVDQLDNKVTNVGSEVGDFLDYRADFYRKYFEEGLRRDGTTVPGASETLQSQFISLIGQNYANELIREGSANRGVAEHTARIVVRHRFTDGLLKGFAVGSTLRWESGKILGYDRKDATFNFGGLANVAGQVNDIENPYIGDPETFGGLFVTYQRKLFNDKVSWRIQLNADNLFTEQGLRVIGANGDGSPVYAVAPPRTFVLTSSFTF